jgi:hypothetical protein
MTLCSLAKMRFLKKKEAFIVKIAFNYKEHP